MLYALAAAGLLALLWGLYALVMPEPTDVFPDELSSPPRDDAEAAADDDGVVPGPSAGEATDPGSDGAGEPGVTDALVTLSSNLDTPRVPGNRVELLVNGTEIFPPMLEAIRSAERSVNFLTYVYWTGSVAEEFAEALADAAARGVEVRVLLDAHGAAQMPNELVRWMEGKGAEVAWFHPLRWYNLRRQNERTHRKVMVVDGRIGFTGGVGIADEWTGDAEDPDHWRDDHFRVTGPVVQYLQGAFAENWREATGEVLSGAEMFPRLDRAGEATVVPVMGQPGGSISRIGFTYWTCLRYASRRVRLSTPYFVPNPDLRSEIVRAARRGVDVQVLVPGDHGDSWLVRNAAQVSYRELLEAGVRLFEFEPTMYHAKAVTVDGEWCAVGSANFDNRSFDLNYEVMLAVQQRGLVNAIDGSFDDDLERSREITLEEVDAWGLRERLTNRAASVLREQL